MTMAWRQGRDPVLFASVSTVTAEQAFVAFLCEFTVLRWELEQMCNEGGEGHLLLQGYSLEDNTFYTHTICVPDVHLRFTIKDDYGDGICW